MSNTDSTALAEPSATTLGIRIPDDLREKIREAARLEERTESSFARFYLGKAADAILSGASTDNARTA